MATEREKAFYIGKKTGNWERYDEIMRGENKPIEGADEEVLNGIYKKYGFNGILNYLAGMAGDEADTARFIHGDFEAVKEYEKIEKTIRGITNFQC